MKTDMNYSKKIRTTRASLTFISVFVAMSLAGCEGGMIGTGPASGKYEAYQLENLPDRISPDIPKTIFRGEDLTPSQPKNLDVIEEKTKISSRMNEIPLGKSEGWFEMNDDLFFASLVRVNAESNATIIDIALNEIRERCADQLIDCTIPGNQIKVKLTQDVVNRLIELFADWAESIPPHILGEDEGVDAAALIKEQFTLIVDSEVVLGETHYSQLDGAPYDHSVRTFLKRGATLNALFDFLLWEGEQFSARWHDDGIVAKFVTNAVDSPTLEYFYQNDIPSELAIASYLSVDDGGGTFGSDIKLVANDRDNAGVLVEVATFVPAPSGFLPVDGEPSPGLNYDLFRGRMDKGGGYSTYDDILFNLADTPEVVIYRGFRESFDNVGNLIARTECIAADFDQGTDVCDDEDFVPTGPVGSSITDSPYYFEPDDFDSLAAVQDVIRWTVEGLPVEFKAIAVVSADPAIDLSERELLCRGFQSVSDDTRIFCSATDEQLANTIVLELVDGNPGRIIPTATLVQIQ
ncbi:MAG: hypothetical protein AB8B64_15475 [Granulosicoccus sp.]